MKKSLVLAMAMAMGVTASAYAANPFSDVPAGHWAYDSISKLATAGVVDGYGTTFGGEKLMTRYEMAQIVAKAMAKGANVDKLAAEFADELDSLGVRVAKLEKKVDNVKITGQIRYSYKNESGKNNAKHMTEHRMRNRFFVNGQVNDNWSYTGMLETNKNFNSKASATSDEKKYNDKVGLKRAYLEGRVGGIKVLAGRWNEFFITDTILDDMIDGAYVEYGLGKGKIYGIAGKGVYENDKDNDRIYVAGVSQKIGPVDAAFNWFKVDAEGEDHQIYNINLDWAFAKDFSMTWRYMWANKDFYKEDNVKVAKDGWFGQLNYKGADPAVANSWGLRVRYFDQPRNVFISPTYDFYCCYHDEDAGYEGWGVGGDYTLAKNIMWSLDYYDTKAKKDFDADGKTKDRCLYSQLWFFF